jgi:hypothetical protein
MKILHPELEKVIRSFEAQQEKRFRKEYAFVGGKNEEKAPEAIGFLTVVATDAETGEIRQIEHGENMVVKLGRSALAHLLAGSQVSNHIVVAMMFGDGTGTVSVNDTGLFGGVIQMAGGANNKPVTIDFPDSGGDDMKVRFTAVVNADEGNGGGTQTYQEACLVKGNNAIFSHKVTGAITKDNTVVLTAAWTYIF